MSWYGFDDSDENYWDQDYIDYMNKTGIYEDSGNNNSYRYSVGSYSLLRNPLIMCWKVVMKVYGGSVYCNPYFRCSDCAGYYDLDLLRRAYCVIPERSTERPVCSE